MGRRVMAMGTLCCLVAACASTQLREVWKNPAWTPPSPRRVLVIGWVPAEAIRYQLEAQLVEGLSTPGVSFVASTQYFPDELGINREAVVALVQREGFDGVLVAKLVDVQRELTRSLPLYAEEMYPFAAHPTGFRAEWVESRKALMETNVYDTRGGGKLLWSAQTETLLGGSSAAQVRRFVKVIAQRLKKDVWS